VRIALEILSSINSQLKRTLFLIQECIDHNHFHGFVKFMHHRGLDGGFLIKGRILHYMKIYAYNSNVITKHLSTRQKGAVRTEKGNDEMTTLNRCETWSYLWVPLSLKRPHLSLKRMEEIS